MPRYQRNRGSGTVVRARRRESLWIGLTFAQDTQTAEGGVIHYALNAAALALRPFTVVRTYMECMLVSDQAAAIENQACAFGWCVVSDQAFAIGITAVPTPVTDIGSDLFYLNKAMFADESNLTDRSKGGSKYSIDSKAMRKVNEDQQPIGVLEMSTAGSGIRFFSAGNMLVKLH